MDKLFKDRLDAAEQLVNKALPIENMKQEDWIVLSASFGGSEIASYIAKQLNSKCDMIFTAAILAENNSSCDIAMISETEELVIHERLQKAFNINIDDIFQQAKEIYNGSLKSTLKQFRDNKSSNNLISLHGKNVLIVDEGLNTGLTTMACIKTVINQGAKSVSIAVPVIPQSIVPDIEAIADDLYYVESIPRFISIDFYYEQLEDVSIETAKKNINN